MYLMVSTDTNYKQYNGKESIQSLTLNKSIRRSVFIVENSVYHTVSKWQTLPTFRRSCYLFLRSWKRRQVPPKCRDAPRLYSK